MKILIACEYSGIVRDAFIARGHDAISCDLLPTEKPGPHYQGDVFDIINNDYDLIIAHPPCTDLAVSGAAHFAKKRADGTQQKSIEFFSKFTELRHNRICIENPVGIMSRLYRKPDQIINPWQFGESISKKTCLWLKELPLLIPTNIVEPGKYITSSTGKRYPEWCWYIKDGKKRSIFFKGIAEAMAEQWG